MTARKRNRGCVLWRTVLLRTLVDMVRDTPKWKLRMVKLLSSASTGCAGYEEVYRSLTLTVTG